MSRRTTTTGWRRQSPRLSWLLVSAGVAASGCAHGPSRTMSQTWQSVPSISWARPSDGKTTDAAESEPKVAANVPSEKSESKTSEGGSRLFRWTSLTGSKPAVAAAEETKPAASIAEQPQDPFLEEELLAQMRKLEDEEEDEEPPVHARRARIMAALNDDSHSARHRTLAKQEHDRLKLRVESLSDRAREYLDEGDLAAAQRTAELAQSLVESSELEFAPEEQRPVDLLALIEAQRESDSPEAAELTQESLLETEEVAATDQESSSATQVSLTNETAAPSESSPAFDPFARFGSSAERPDGSQPAAEGPLVLLESPTFDDETEDQPSTVETEPLERLRSERRPLAMAELSNAHRSVKKLDPFSEGIDDAEMESDSPAAETPLREELPKLVAAAPEAEPAGPLPKPEIFSIDDEEEDPSSVRSATVWPRWMSISGLCLLVGAFGIWLRRQRMMSRS